MIFSLLFLLDLLVAEQRVENRPTEAETISVIGISALICSEELFPNLSIFSVTKSVLV